MNGKNFYSVFFSELKSKWFIIVILAFVLCGGLIFEKRGNGDNVIYVSTSAYAQVMVKVVFDDPNVPHQYTVPDSGLFTASGGEKYAFMKETEKIFDYSKFNANFPVLNEENKFLWLDKRLMTLGYYPDLFAVAFWVKDEDAKDLEYTNANVEKYVSDYVEFCSKKLQAAGIGHLEIIDKSFVPAEGSILPTNSFMLKYGIIGAVLGTVVGVLIVAGLAMRKISNG